MKRIVVLTVFVVMLYVTPAAFAKPDFLSEFKKSYPNVKNTRLDSCIICHKNDNPYLGDALNTYGAAWDKSGRNFSTIAAQDSDGDGFANKDEIAALTFPGDINDKPEGSSDDIAPEENASKCGGLSCASNGNVKSLLGDWLLVGLTISVLLSLSGIKRSI